MYSEEHKHKISDALMGHSTSPETRAKISATLKGHVNSPEMRVKDAASHAGLHHSPETLEKMSEWQRGNLCPHWKGGQRVTNRKAKAKRRGLGFLALNSPFVGCEGHHVNQTTVIYVPKELNQGFSHDIWAGRGMEKINALAVQWLTGDGFSC